MTEAELLDMVKREVAGRRERPEARPKTAARCRSCWTENASGAERCERCDRPLARVQPGRALSCPEAGETSGTVTFVVTVDGERRALLGRGGRLVVGRGEQAEVWLEGATVSRKHLEIVWDEGAACPRFRDLGSANGTRHRGILRGEGLLHPGEVLEVGHHRLGVVREERPALLPDQTDEELDAFFDDGPEFEGPLGPGVSSFVLRALATAQRTGTIELALSRGVASVVLAAGRVVTATAGRLSGLAALHVILAAEAGAYRFRRSFEVDDREPVNLSVDEVLAAVG